MRTIYAEVYLLLFHWVQSRPEPQFLAGVLLLSLQLAMVLVIVTVVGWTGVLETGIWDLRFSLLVALLVLGPINYLLLHGERASAFMARASGTSPLRAKVTVASVPTALVTVMLIDRILFQ